MMTTGAKISRALAGLLTVMGVCTIGLRASRAETPDVHVFSSLCTEAAGGDITGLRIKVAGIPPTISLDETQGALMVSSETKDATYAPATGQITFKMQTETGLITFQGQMTAMALDGTLAREGDTPEIIHLPSDTAGGDGEAACPAAAGSARP